MASTGNGAARTSSSPRESRTRTSVRIRTTRWTTPESTTTEYRRPRAATPPSSSAPAYSSVQFIDLSCSFFFFPSMRRSSPPPVQSPLLMHSRQVREDGREDRGGALAAGLGGGAEEGGRGARSGRLRPAVLGIVREVPAEQIRTRHGTYWLCGHHLAFSFSVFVSCLYCVCSCAFDLFLDPRRC